MVFLRGADLSSRQEAFVDGASGGVEFFSLSSRDGVGSSANNHPRSSQPLPWRRRGPTGLGPLAPGGGFPTPVAAPEAAVLREPPSKPIPSNLGFPSIHGFGGLDPHGLPDFAAVLRRQTAGRPYFPLLTVRQAASGGTRCTGTGVGAIVR